MIDGLALGETTPGPLIMVVTFVGFVGGWTHAAAQGLSPALAGLLGGAGGHVFHVPAVVRVHLRRRAAGRSHARPAPVHRAADGDHRRRGRRHRESRGLLRLARVLARGFEQAPDWLSLAIAAGAALALFWLRAGVIPVILACGAVGLVCEIDSMITA